MDDEDMLTRKRIAIDDLRLGMYVAGFGPFLVKDTVFVSS